MKFYKNMQGHFVQTESRVLYVEKEEILSDLPENIEKIREEEGIISHWEVGEKISEILAKKALGTIHEEEFMTEFLEWIASRKTFIIDFDCEEGFSFYHEIHRNSIGCNSDCWIEWKYDVSDFRWLYHESENIDLEKMIEIWPDGKKEIKDLDLEYDRESAERWIFDLFPEKEFRELFGEKISDLDWSIDLEISITQKYL